MNHWFGGREVHSQGLHGASLAWRARRRGTRRYLSKLPWATTFALAFVVSDNTWAKERQVRPHVAAGRQIQIRNPEDLALITNMQVEWEA